jgi:hypothetical protein
VEKTAKAACTGVCHRGRKSKVVIPETIDFLIVSGRFLDPRENNSSE